MAWRLPLSTAERLPGATFLKISVRTLLLLLHFSACRGSPPRRRTNAGCLHFFGHASKLIYDEGVYSSAEILYLYWLLLWVFSRRSPGKLLEVSSSNTFYGFFFSDFWDFFARKFRELFVPRKFLRWTKFPHIYGEGILPNGLGRRYIYSWHFIQQQLRKIFTVRCCGDEVYILR